MRGPECDSRNRISERSHPETNEQREFRPVCIANHLIRPPLRNYRPAKTLSDIYQKFRQYTPPVENTDSFPETFIWNPDCEWIELPWQAPPSGHIFDASKGRTVRVFNFVNGQMLMLAGQASQMITDWGGETSRFQRHFSSRKAAATQAGDTISQLIHIGAIHRADQS